MQGRDVIAYRQARPGWSPVATARDGMFLGSPLKLLTATRVAESQSAQRWVSLRSYPNESGPNHRCRAAGARARHVPTDDAVSETPGIRAGRFSHLCVARLASFRAMAHVQLPAGAPRNRR
jgi:hypothetical protein